MGPDYPDYTSGYTIVTGNLSQVPGPDYPDWTDGVLDITGNILQGEDFPDWVKAIGQVSIPISSPPSLSNLVGWWDASQIAGVTDGATLTDWPDKSGNGYDLTGHFTGNFPTFYNSTASRLVNGKPAVWFPGGSNGLWAPAQQFTSATDGSTTAYYVAHGDGASVTEGVGDAGVGNPAHDTYRIYLNPGLNMEFRNMAGSVFSLTDAAPSSSVVSMFAVSVNGTTLQATGWVNATKEGPVALSGTLNTATSGPVAGSEGPFFVNTSLVGPVCEMIVYNTAHSDTTVGQVYAYLKDKWGTF